MHLPEIGEIHDQYLALARLARDRGGRDGSLGGRLLLRAGFDGEGISVLIAGGLAGAAALCVDGDGELLREGLRHGLCDFVVGDLSEALRILKNEVRRRRAVSVCVGAEPEALLVEMAERGVQPELVSLELGTSVAAVFQERGAATVPAAQAESGMERLSWRVEAQVARVLPGLARIAAAVLDEQRDDTRPRRHWLADSPRWLGRSYAGRQCLRMTETEAEAFMRQAPAEFPGVSFAHGPPGD